MRTDATIDGRAVPCPNASLLGYGRGKAKVGDFIVYSDDAWPSSPRTFARMIGRVHYAPPCGETPAIRDWILALVLSSTGDSVGIRWIDPKLVTFVQDSPHKIAAFFFGSLAYDRDTLIRLSEHGTLSEQYIENAPARVAMFAERERKSKLAGAS